MEERRHIALATHGGRKQDLLERAVHCVRSTYRTPTSHHRDHRQDHRHFFLWDPDDIPTYGVHVKNLLGTSGSYNIPTVCNRSNADFIISNILFHGAHILILKD
jgi:methylglyoxal synthase